MAQFCSHCGTRYANESAKYCYNCGEERAEQLDGVDEIDNSDERNLIESYFHLGYKYKDIVDMLSLYHSISMSIRTLKRRLLKYDLKKKSVNLNDDELRNIIKNEMKGVGKLAGYRKIWHILRIKYHVHAPRKRVAEIMHDLDPQASNERKGNKLKKRKYMSYGPNHCWHIDGYDKIKLFGFPIHAAIYGFSRKVLWLEVCRSNNSPIEPTKCYLDCVNQLGGCPLLTRTDYGTENVHIAAIQCYFRSDEEGHQYGTSTRNQQIENWWSHFRKSCSNWWINFFKNLTDNGTINLEDTLHKECLWFCFQGIIQESLNAMKEYWNTHYIRPSRHETVPGVPDLLFYLPQTSGHANCLCPVSNDKISEMIAQHNHEIEEENTYQEYFLYIMDLEEISYPVNPDEAISLFSYLMQKACGEMNVDDIP